MLDNKLVLYPIGNTKVTKKRLKSGTYIYYETERVYNANTRHTTPKRKCIGKIDPDNPDHMFPNQNFHIYFPVGYDVSNNNNNGEVESDDIIEYDDSEEESTETKPKRSSSLSIGAFIAIKKICERLKLDEMLAKAIEDDVNCGLFLDFAAYEIIEKSNVAQHFPAYAFKHPLFTPKMEIYSDSKLSSLFKHLTDDQRQSFLNQWNSNRDKEQQIYVSYDSTNRHTKAGDIEEAEYGKSKDGQEEPIINQGVAYDCENREPLFYDSYPGSIVDVSMLEHMVKAAFSYGYDNIGFILDRGYFSRHNLFYMDRKHYNFIIMAKGNAKFIRSLVDEAMGTFEVERKYLIKKFMVYGTTIIRKIFPEEKDDKKRFVHVYYNELVSALERNRFENHLLKLENELNKRLGKKTNAATLKGYSQYFNFQINDGILESYAPKDEYIEDEKFWMGYFCIVTSLEMTAKQALYLYKGRDASEKLFLIDKSFLGNNTYRVYEEESKDSKEWIGFVAEIMRNKIYTYLIDAQERLDTKSNLLTVPAALEELEKYEICERLTGGYSVHHPLTKTQKKIYSILQISKKEVEMEAENICKVLNGSN